MSEKLECPGCHSYGSDIYRAVFDLRPCPHCDLAAEAILEVGRIRRERADERLKGELADALLRVGKSEAELRRLREFAEDVRRALAALSEGEVL